MSPVKVSQALLLHRSEILRVVALRRVGNVPVFGSVVHGTDADGSDLDILVDPTSETTPFDIGGIQYELQNLLGIDVDIVTSDALPDSFRDSVLAEAQRLESWLDRKK